MITTADPSCESQVSWPNGLPPEKQMNPCMAGKSNSEIPNERDGPSVMNNTNPGNVNFGKPFAASLLSTHSVMSENLSILRPLFQRVSDFNFDFDADGILRHLQTGEPFSMKMASNVPSLKRQEMIRAICTRLVRQRLFELKLESSQIPIPGHPHLCLRVLHSSNFFTYTGPILIILQAGGVSQAGVWAPRLLLHAQHGLRSGSQVSLVQKAIELGYAVAIVNANEHVPSEAEMDTIELISTVQHQVPESGEFKFPDRGGHSFGVSVKAPNPNGNKMEVSDSHTKSCSTGQPLLRHSSSLPEGPSNQKPTNSSTPVQCVQQSSCYGGNLANANMKPPTCLLPSTSSHPSALSSLLAGPSTRTLTSKTKFPNLSSQSVTLSDLGNQPSGSSTSSYQHCVLRDKSSVIIPTTASEPIRIENTQQSGNFSSQRPSPSFANPTTSENRSNPSVLPPPCAFAPASVPFVTKQPSSSTTSSNQGAGIRFTVSQLPNLHPSTIYPNRRTNPPDGLNFPINSNFNRPIIPISDDICPSYRPFNRYSNENRMFEVSLEDRIYGIWRQLVPHCASNQIYVWAHQLGGYAFVHPLTPMPGVYPGFLNPVGSTNYAYSGNIHPNPKLIPTHMSMLNCRPMVGGSVSQDGNLVSSEQTDKPDAFLFPTNWSQVPLTSPANPILSDKVVLQSCSQFMSQPIHGQIPSESCNFLHPPGPIKTTDHLKLINLNPHFNKPHDLCTITESQMLTKCKVKTKEQLAQTRPATRSRFCPTRRRHFSAGPILVSSTREDLDALSKDHPSLEKVNCPTNGTQWSKPMVDLKNSSATRSNRDLSSDIGAKQSQTSSGRLWLDRRVFGPWRHHVTPEAARRAFWMPEDNPILDENGNQPQAVPLPSGNIVDAAVSAQRGGLVPRTVGVWSNTPTPGSSTHDNNPLHFRLMKAWQRKAERLWHEISTRVRAVVFTDSPDLLDLRAIGVGWGLNMLQDSKTNEGASSDSVPKLYHPSVIQNGPPKKVKLVRKWFSEHAVHFVAAGLPINTRVDQNVVKPDEIPILSSGTAEHDLIPAYVLDVVFEFFKSKSE